VSPSTTAATRPAGQRHPRSGRDPIRQATSRGSHQPPAQALRRRPGRRGVQLPGSPRGPEQPAASRTVTAPFGTAAGLRPSQGHRRGPARSPPRSGRKPTPLPHPAHFGADHEVTASPLLLGLLLKVPNASMLWDPGYVEREGTKVLRGKRRTEQNACSR